MATNRYQPAILGGLFIGVLSSLPIVGALNLCCCLWVVVGGLLATYLRQQQEPAPLAPADALLGGLLAGVIGALLNGIAGWALLSATGPIWQDQVANQIESMQMPDEARALMLRLTTGRGIVLIQLAISLPVYAVFSALGSLLGLAFFKKKAAPPPPTSA